MEGEKDHWRRVGATDCYQDRCENVPFASTGGLEKRGAMTAPAYAVEHAAEYLEGYRAAALELYGDDWQSCEFSWQPAITINPKDGAPDGQ